MSNEERIGTLEEKSRRNEEELKLRVTLDRFTPVEKVVYGFLVLVATVGSGVLIKVLSDGT